SLSGKPLNHPSQLRFIEELSKINISSYSVDGSRTGSVNKARDKLYCFSLLPFFRSSLQPLIDYWYHAPRIYAYMLSSKSCV
ncbi:MAG TPA: hypothetical protein VF884_08355, partial [Nitrososphaeraceae archaeon]